MLKIIPKEDYNSVPWENGRGITSDIFLSPDGATRQNFDIRISVAPITADAPFSLFTGIDRQLTLFKGAGLDLNFSSRSLKVRPLSPVSFDNGESLFARLVEGPVEVFNVLTRRGRWTAHVEIVRRNARVSVGRDEIGVIFVAEGEWIAEAGGEIYPLQNGGTGIIAQPGAITLSATAPSAAIFAVLRRAI